MSFEARLFAMRHLQAEISAARTSLMGSTDDPMRRDQRTHATDELIARGAKWEQMVERHRKDIENRVYNANVALAAKPPGPGGRGPGPTRDRHRNQMHLAKRLDAALAAVAAELAAFNTELWAGPNAEKRALDALATVLQNMAEGSKASHEKELLAAVEDLSGTLPVPVRQPGFGVDLLVLVAALLALLKSRGRGKPGRTSEKAPAKGPAKAPTKGGASAAKG